nr:MAG TPA: hypothetical protein [Caudoviricetes sp.]
MPFHHPLPPAEACHSCTQFSCRTQGSQGAMHMNRSKDTFEPLRQYPSELTRGP